MLLEYAGHEFLLNSRQKDGATLRDHLQKVYLQKGKIPKQLEPVEMPYELFYLWEWFCELSPGRGYSGNVPAPLTYNEIQAWANLTKSEPTAWEVEAIKLIDRKFLEEAMKK
ncbi:MAG: hypothetical protein PHW03_05270 [Eubacteriales bacterium]|nr:hypothetical protein [Eubacteriales bacterium]